MSRRRRLRDNISRLDSENPAVDESLARGVLSVGFAPSPPRSIISRKPVHPYLTNYGPASLQEFLRKQKQSNQGDTREHEKDEKVDSSPCASLRASGRHMVESLGDHSAENFEEHHSGLGKEKGKALRREEVSVEITNLENNPSLHQNLQRGHNLQTTIHPKRYARSKCSSRPSYVSSPNESSTFHCVKTRNDQVLHPFDTECPAHSEIPGHPGCPLRPVDANRRLVKTLHNLSRYDLDQRPENLSVPPIWDAQCTTSFVESTAETLDDLSFESGYGSADNSYQPNTHRYSVVASRSARLKRSASFEAHSNQTRDSLRANDKRWSLSAQFPEELGRRRKTPTANSLLRPRSDFHSGVAPHFEQKIPHGTSMDSSHIAYHNSPRAGLLDAPNLTIEELQCSIGDLVTLRGPCLQSPADLFLETDSDVPVFDDESEDNEEAVDDILFSTGQNTVSLPGEADRYEQEAILASFQHRHDDKSPESDSLDEVQEFDYEQIVEGGLVVQSSRNETGHKTSLRHGLVEKRGRTALKDRNSLSSSSRKLELKNAGTGGSQSIVPLCSSKVSQSGFSAPPDHARSFLPFEIWAAGVLDYLSSAEVRSLRLVCKSLAEDLEPYVFRSVVINFGPSFFNINHDFRKDGKHEESGPGLLLGKYGPEINKFGIAFECDYLQMTKAPYKVTETMIDAWFGQYKWPVKDYPYFSSLKEIDKVLEDQPRILAQSMKNLRNCHELALSVDSGHGWLEGPDMSDLAVYRDRCAGGSPVFGKAFPATDKAHEEGLKNLFVWAQRKTITENIRRVENTRPIAQDEIDALRAIVIRGYESFRTHRLQPDFEKDLHTGKEYVHPTAPRPTSVALHPAFQVHNHLHQIAPLQTQPAPANAQGQRRRQRSLEATRAARQSSLLKSHSQRAREPVYAQWPLIFNGYNISADMNGDVACIHERIADPWAHPLLPATLKEAQAQWLMETSWIQRTFLSAYTDSVRINAPVFRRVHSLHISKISSGLLPSLNQGSFWKSLPDLRNVTILVKPDWRVEHIPGDKFYHSSMSTRLIDAALKFAELLRSVIARIENLNSLHIGYCSGGEHQKGIFGRNQHILPAPITSNPKQWLLAVNPTSISPSEDTMFCFPHIRTLTFENCWMSPHMLETLMRKSRDTSLHNLVLNSVSLTARVHSTRIDGPLRTFDNQLRCEHPTAAWLQETIPSNASWVHLLDEITPGRTISDQKYDLGLINEEETPRPQATFRGNIQKITLHSCGYVKIRNVTSSEFNQNDLVLHSLDWKSQDDGIKLRASDFHQDHQPQASSEGNDGNGNESTNIAGLINMPDDARSRLASFHDRQRQNSTFNVMQGGNTAQELLSHTPCASQSGMLTGFLTQCIHPVEKRILEQNWGMEFGWGDDMRRWEAVEDGWFMGGTGRFSGIVHRELAMQEEQNAVALQKRQVEELVPCEKEDLVEHADNGRDQSDFTVPHDFANSNSHTSLASSCVTGPSSLQSAYAHLHWMPQYAYGDANNAEDNSDDGEE